MLLKTFILTVHTNTHTHTHTHTHNSIKNPKLPYLSKMMLYHLAQLTGQLALFSMGHFSLTVFVGASMV